MNKNYLVVIIFAILFLATNIFYFPSFYASIDEHEYLKNSTLLGKGTIFEEDILHACRSTLTENGFISSYPLGKSVFLIPFTLLGFNAVMLSGLIINLINLVIIFFLLKKQGLPEYYSLLYLFFPLFLWQGRTLYPGILALTFVLTGLYFFISNRKTYFFDSAFFSGFAFGTACWVRYEAVLASIPFFVSAFVSDKKKFFKMLIGFTIPIAILMLFNNFAYGGFFRVGYGDAVSIIVGASRTDVLFNILIYSVLMSLVYPLLFLSPLLSKVKARLEIFSVALLYVFFFS